MTAINDGYAKRPLEGFIKNADLAQVQEVMKAAFLPTDALQITFNTLVLKQNGRLTLIDTGNGDSGAPTSGTWMTNFKAAGFDPAQVDTVVFSHFHGDHINGFRLKDGTVVFPKAEIMVPAAEWDFWMDDARMAQAPDSMKGGFQGVRRVFAPVAKDVKRYEAGREILPGLTAIAAPGHTPGHTAYMLSSGNGRLMIMSDVTNHPALFVRNPDWSAVFDMDADQARDHPPPDARHGGDASGRRSRSITRPSPPPATSPATATASSLCRCSGAVRSEIGASTPPPTPPHKGEESPRVHPPVSAKSHDRVSGSASSGVMNRMIGVS